MNRLIALAYGVATYFLMFLTFLYLFGFLANFAVPKSIDSGAIASPGVAFVINLMLISLFGVSHSVMARPAFKKWWTQYVPQSVERTTYVLVATVITMAIFWLWQPLPAMVWQLDAVWAQVLVWGLYCLGIVILFASTFVINHFDLFGLRQVTLNFIRKPYKHLPFKVTYFYKFVRHPLYVGWLLIFWATPSMTVGHLLFAIGMGAYIFMAIPYEERDLETFHGATYTAYKKRVPMLLPAIGKVHETVDPKSSEPFPRDQLT